MAARRLLVAVRNGRKLANQQSNLLHEDSNSTAEDCQALIAGRTAEYAAALKRYRVSLESLIPPKPATDGSRKRRYAAPAAPVRSKTGVSALPRKHRR